MNFCARAEQTATGGVDRSTGTIARAIRAVVNSWRAIVDAAWSVIFQFGTRLCHFPFSAIFCSIFPRLFFQSTATSSIEKRKRDGGRRARRYRMYRRSRADFARFGVQKLLSPRHPIFAKTDFWVNSAGRVGICFLYCRIWYATPIFYYLLMRMYMHERARKHRGRRSFSRYTHEYTHRATYARVGWIHASTDDENLWVNA